MSTMTTIVVTELTLKDKILQLAEQGFSRQDIAKTLHTTYQQVYQVVRTKQVAFEQTALNRDVLTPRIQYVRHKKRIKSKAKKKANQTTHTTQHPKNSRRVDRAA